MECPNCGCDLEFEEEVNVDDYLPTHKLILDTDDAVDFVFTKLLKEGYAPRSAEIFLVLEYYQDYIEFQIAEYFKGEKKKDGNNKNDDNYSI